MSEPERTGGGAALIASLVFVLVLGVGTILTTKWLANRIAEANATRVTQATEIAKAPMPCVVVVLSSGESIRNKGYALVDDKTGILYLFKSEDLLVQFMLKGYVDGSGGAALTPGVWMSYWLFPVGYCDEPQAAQPSRYSDQRGKPSTI